MALILLTCNRVKGFITPFPLYLNVSLSANPYLRVICCTVTTAASSPGNLTSISIPLPPTNIEEKPFKTMWVTGFSDAESSFNITII